MSDQKQDQTQDQANDQQQEAIGDADDLWSAEQAAHHLHVHPATAARHAQRAFREGEPGITRRPGRWYATPAWWRKEFTDHPPNRGRPPQQ